MYPEPWHIYNKKGIKIGVMYFDGGIAFNSAFTTERLRFMEGWGEDQVNNWLKSVGWYSEDK